MLGRFRRLEPGSSMANCFISIGASRGRDLQIPGGDQDGRTADDLTDSENDKPDKE